MIFGLNNQNRRIAISGTYSSGKTTIVKKLSALTRIPPAVARGMREILPETFPGKKLEECTPSELVQLGMIRYGERRVLESGLQSGFISDGSALHEWAYGHGRELEGTNGKGSEIFGDDYRFAIAAFGNVVKLHSKRAYTDVVHLPVEFPLDADGHRPVSEAFRQKADEILMKTWHELGFKPHIIGGTVEERLEKIIQVLGLDISPTSERAQTREDGSLWYASSEDALGDSRERYFSNGFRNTQHDISNIGIFVQDGIIKADVGLSYRASWSCKNGSKCKPHLSSIDAILIFGQLTQMLMYAQDGITRDESRNLWLRDLELNPGCKPIEDTSSIPAELRIVKSCKPKMAGKYWHAATIDGNINHSFGIKARVGYELPERLQV